jgi:hypothetical protein
MGILERSLTVTTHLAGRCVCRRPHIVYTRISGGLKHLGHDVARNTIKAILRGHGIEPAPERRRKTPWKSLDAAHERSARAPMVTGLMSERYVVDQRERRARSVPVG